MGTHAKRKQMTWAYRYSSSRLALNYYAFYESLYENPSADPKVLARYKAFHPLLQGFLNGTIDLEALDSLRNQVIHDMEILTAYVDCFQIYEYVLNRMERRFLEADPVTMSIDEFASRITGVIAGNGDTALMNQQIQEVMGQLPIRYTRQKFYSLVMERLTVYAGAGKKSLEDLLYMLETSAMVKLPAGMKEERPELYDLLEVLRQADYRDMEKAAFENCQGCVTLGSSRLNNSADDLLILMDLINDLYVLQLCKEEALMDGMEEQAVRQILSGVWDHFEAGRKEMLADEITEMLSKLEGIQESAFGSFLQSGDQEQEKDPVMVKIDLLLSGSSFVSLEIEKGQEEPADRKWIEKQGEAFCGRLDETLKALSKPVMRAVMAKILSALPNIFTNARELEDYIKNSLESCTDVTERETSMELLSGELLDEDALV